jgi:hypothetical protein
MNCNRRMYSKILFVLGALTGMAGCAILDHDKIRLDPAYRAPLDASVIIEFAEWSAQRDTFVRVLDRRGDKLEMCVVSCTSPLVKLGARCDPTAEKLGKPLCQEPQDPVLDTLEDIRIIRFSASPKKCLVQYGGWSVWKDPPC